MVKRVRGTKVKVFFQGLHMTHVFVLICNFVICILGTPFNTAFQIMHFDYKLILYNVYYAFMPFIT
jgi:hypothetical protein